MRFDQNLILIIVAAIIGISRLIARIAQSARDESQRRKSQAQQVPSARSEDERLRQLMEALGHPASPPPPIQPRTYLPPRPVAPLSPPRTGPFPPRTLRRLAEKSREILQRPGAKSPPPMPQTSPANEPGAWMSEEEKIEKTAAKFERETRGEQAPSTSAETNWRNALRSPNGVRSAMVLREILGPPRALEQIEFV